MNTIPWKPADTPRLSPYLLVEDAAAEIEFLAKAFGFREIEAHRVQPDPNGPIVHTEVRLDDAVVMMGHPGPDYRNPKNSGSPSVLLYVYVEDVDAHYEVARKAGAQIKEEIQDVFYGDRRYAAYDVEGHEWNFATQKRIVDPSHWDPSGA